MPSANIISAGSTSVGEMLASSSFRYTVQLRTTRFQDRRRE
jgi:hypothetical protein